ncbi:dTDP-4-dehydrorhamnose reductase [Klebsiella pneumoniae]|nr:dTDP-4-dehydrorhamnose reductase [Klebsiella pneumoniae]
MPPRTGRGQGRKRAGALRPAERQRVAVLAAESAKLGALMVHYSTDYVFDGAGSHYRREDEATGPLNVYGETKRAGELALEQEQPASPDFPVPAGWQCHPRRQLLAKTMLARRVRKRRSPSLTTSTGRPPVQSCWQTARRRQSVKRCLVIRRWPVPHLVASGEDRSLVRLRPLCV